MSGMMSAHGEPGESDGTGSGDQMKQMTGGGGMMGGGMVGGGMMGKRGGCGSGGVTKKDMKLLTRTDFLLQFVWIPVKPGSLPKTPEELKTKLEDEAKKLTEAEKAYAADTSTAKLEETIEAESLKKSKAIRFGPGQGIRAARVRQAAPATRTGGVPGGDVAPPGGGAAPKGGGPRPK